MTTSADVGTLGVVIVHFHREVEAARLVESLVTGHGVAPDRIVVVDNGSDGERLRTELTARSVDPLVDPLDNVGYAAAMNHGVRRLPGQVDTVLLLTHEVVLAPGCIDALLSFLRSSPGIGAVGPLLLCGDRTVWSAGGDLTRVRRLPRHRDHLAPLTDPPGAPRDCTWLDGSVVLISRRTWEEIGGLDERYFLYAEDVDLGLRLRRRGLRVVVEPGARARQSPSGDIDPFLWTRNTFLLFRAHRFRLAWVLWLASVLVGITRDRLRRSEDAEIPRRLTAMTAGMMARTGPPPPRRNQPASRTFGVES